MTKYEGLREGPDKSLVYVLLLEITDQVDLGLINYTDIMAKVCHLKKSTS
jgi:hypothetical protein